MRRSVTRILALDLGTTTGWCLRDGNDVKTGRWKLHRSQGEKGIQLGRLVRDAIQEHGPDLVGFEVRWSYFVGQSEGDLKVDSDGLQSPRGPA